MFHFKVKDS